MRISASFHHDSRHDSLSSDTQNRRTLRQLGTAYLPKYQDAARADGEMKYIYPGGIGFRHAYVSPDD
jgi:hypothetical protein